MLHIYVSYAILNNIYLYLDRISYNTVQSYQLVRIESVLHVDIRTYSLIYDRNTSLVKQAM
jgi:hypothetical protein